MSDGTKVGPFVLKGKVFNRSDSWVWVLFDVDGVVTAKYLAPGFKSPTNIDADAVKTTDPGVTIDGYTEWWKLPSCLVATVSDSFWGGLTIDGSIPGLLSKTKEADWGSIHYDTTDTKWGKKIPWWG